MLTTKIFTQWQISVIPPIFINWNSVRKRCPSYPIYLLMHSSYYINVDSWICIWWADIHCLSLLSVFLKCSEFGCWELFQIGFSDPHPLCFHTSLLSSTQKCSKPILYFLNNFLALESATFSSVFCSFENYRNQDLGI